MNNCGRGVACVKICSVSTTVTSMYHFEGYCLRDMVNVVVRQALGKQERDCWLQACDWTWLNLE